MLIIGNGRALAAANAVEVFMNLRLSKLLTVIPFQIESLSNDYSPLLLLPRTDPGRPAISPPKKSPPADERPHAGFFAEASGDAFVAPTRIPNESRILLRRIDVKREDPSGRSAIAAPASDTPRPDLHRASPVAVH
jgi:hypothetical protein